MTAFFIGLALGGFFGALGMSLFTIDRGELPREAPPADPPPRAITRLTNRERTIEL